MRKTHQNGPDQGQEAWCQATGKGCEHGLKNVRALRRVERAETLLGSRPSRVQENTTTHLWQPKTGAEGTSAETEEGKITSQQTLSGRKGWRRDLTRRT